jgi:hypothetical protein
MHLKKMLDWRKALIYLHRWAGIALTAVFVVWFVSSVIFVYVGMPALPAEGRLSRMEALDVSTLAIAPAEAAQRADCSHPHACASPRAAAGRCTVSSPATPGGWCTPIPASRSTASTPTRHFP